jgi:hypothetical protein
LLFLECLNGQITQLDRDCLCGLLDLQGVPRVAALSSKTDVAPLVSCAHCGLQLPKDEALRAVSPREGATDSPSTAKPALYFCGKAHARLGPQGERAE